MVPMDGFHFDDAVLLARNGAPFTFGVGGKAALLRRSKGNTEDEIAVPVYDRCLENSRAGGQRIGKTTPLLLVEGNDLLLTQRPWTMLRHFHDLTVVLSAPVAELEMACAALDRPRPCPCRRAQTCPAQ